MKQASKREYSVVFERDEEGYYVASAPELSGEAIGLCPI